MASGADKSVFSETDLRQRIRMLEAVADKAPDGLFVKDADGKYRMCNRAAARLVGRAHDQLIGQDDAGLFGVEAAATLAAQDRRVIATGNTEVLETAISADGVTRVLKFTKSPHLDCDGKVVGVIGVIQQVSEKKPATASEPRSRDFAAELEQQKLVALVEHSQDFIAVAGLEGQLIFMNAGGRRMIGVDAESDIRRLHFRDYVPADWHDRHKASIDQVREHGRWEGETQFRHLKTGALIDVVRTAFLIRTATGEPSCLATVTRDITLKKRSDQALRDRERLLRVVTSSARVGLVVLNDRYEYLFTNAAYCDLVGLDADKIVGCRVPDIRPQHWQAMQPLIDRALAGERVIVDRPFPFGGGVSETRLLQVNYEPSSDDAGRPAVVAVMVDVTDQLRSDQAVRDRERLLSIVTSSARVGLVIVNERYEYLFANEAYAEILNLRMDAVLGRRVPDVLSHAWIQIQPRLDSALAGQRVVYELALPDRAGAKERRLRVMYEPSVDAGGRPTVVVVVVDITEQKRTEEAVRESEERFRNVLDFSPANVFLKDLDGRFLFVNRQAALALHAQPEDFIGKNVHDFFPPELAERFDGTDRRVLCSLQPHQFEESVKLADGRYINLLSTQFPLLDSDGRPYAICGISTDITAHRRAEEQRDRLWQHAPDPMCIAGFDGLLRQLNPAWTRVLGWSEEDLLGSQLMGLLHPDDLAVTAQLLEPMLRGETVTGFENRYRCKDGNYRWFSWSIIPIPAAEMICGLARDVTEEKRLAEQFRHAQKMEAIGRLAGGVAHDFNNLLTIINGYSELLLQKTPLDDPKRSQLMDISDAGKRAAGLTAQLLAFSRRAIVETKIVDVNGLVESNSRLLRRLIGENIRIELVLDPDLGYVKADPGQLDQVIMNLAINARDAMPNGGTLRLETSKVVFTDNNFVNPPGVSPGQYICLTVCDGGHGMTDEVKSRIFEPFFTTKAIGKGTGLGLAVVHGVVKQCGGHVAVESSVGVGTTFRLLFPAVDNGVGNSDRKSDATSSRSCRTLLLVEDETAVRNLVRTALENEGYTIFAAASAPEAIGLFETNLGSIQLIITDLVMPGMNGRQLAAELRARKPNLRVLFMSGYTEDVLLRIGQLEDSESFLEKPFTSDDLLAKIRELLDRRAEEILS